MRNLLFIVCLFFVPHLLLAQDKPEDKMSLTADLEIGNVLKFEKSSIEFLKVVSDSRCPRQVTCIWQGEAKVLLGIELGGKYIEKEIVVSGGIAEIPLTKNLLVKVSNLQPYPQTGAGIAPEEYNIKIAAIFPAEGQ
jgi:hypothetical protein